MVEAAFGEGDQVGWVGSWTGQFAGTVVDPHAGGRIAVLWYRGYPTGYLGLHEPCRLKQLAEQS